MPQRALKVALTMLAMVVLGSAASAGGLPQAGTKYQVVKVCSLLSIAEVKKLAPWEPLMDEFAKAEEEPIGTTGSSCSYPSVFIQVMAFQRSFIDAAKKTEIPVEPVSGVGDEAYLRNNQNRYAELIARVGPHSLTVQFSIGRTTFEAAKPTLMTIGKAYAAKLR